MFVQSAPRWGALPILRAATDPAAQEWSILRPWTNPMSEAGTRLSCRRHLIHTTRKHAQTTLGTFRGIDRRQVRNLKIRHVSPRTLPDHSGKSRNRRRCGMEATGGFEPPNRGFANPRLRPLGYVAPEVLRVYCGSAASSEPSLVPRVGLEPTRPFEHYALNVACLPISASRQDRAGFTRPFHKERSCGRSGRIRTRDLWFWRPTL